MIILSVHYNGFPGEHDTIVLEVNDTKPSRYPTLYRLALYTAWDTETTFICEKGRTSFW